MDLSEGRVKEQAGHMWSRDFVGFEQKVWGICLPSHAPIWYISRPLLSHVDHFTLVLIIFLVLW